MSLAKTRIEMIKKGAQKGASGNPLFSYTCPISWAPFTIIGDGGGAVQGRSVKGCSLGFADVGGVEGNSGVVSTSCGALRARSQMLARITGD